MTSSLVLALGVVATAGAAQPLSPSAAAWNALARADAQAALQLIQDNHPGAAPELGDKVFLQRLATARANVDRRLPLVKDFGGHAAVMNGLANEFGDGHIWSRSLYSLRRRTWAGLITTRVAGRWIVGAQDRQESEPDLTGASLAGCDGRTADAMAGELISTFYTQPGNEAGLIGNAPNLLLDHNNPFVLRPDHCRFERPDGTIVEHRLAWREASLASIEKLVAQGMPSARAGMGVSEFTAGQWIALESLDNRAASVVQDVRARQAAMRAAPMVVVDLRGNSGGNSQYAVEIARALVGDARVAAAEAPASACSGMYWRTSKDNAAALAKFASELPADRAPEWRAQAEALARAVEQGRAFSPDLPACARLDTRPAPPPARLPPSAMTGRLIVVTDRACFSSCLMAADLFRRLGALHVGEATDISTRYMEVREIVLPSGLRTFSTLQKVQLGRGDYGPYQPAVAYPGALSDTEALKAWVTALPR